MNAVKGMRLLQTESIESNRAIPDWAKGIASPHIISFSPKNEEDSVRFLSYATLLSKVYMKVITITPHTVNSVHSADSGDTGSN